MEERVGYYKGAIYKWISELFKLFCMIHSSWSMTTYSLRPRKPYTRTSLVAQWLRILLPMQGTRVRALVQEDPICCQAAEPMHHNYWSPHPLGPVCRDYWARMLQLLKPACLELVLCNKRSHRNEKPAHHNEGWPLLAAARGSPCAATKTQRSQN